MVLISRPVGAVDIEVSASNVRGLGAVQLAQSLLPAIDAVEGSGVTRMWLPATGPLSSYHGRNSQTRYQIYRRSLPNAVSRVVECLMPSRVYPQGSALLVLGDVPLRHRGKQAIFVHRPHMFDDVEAGSGLSVSGWIMRRLFALNLPYVDRVIVQTHAMAERLTATYPATSGRIVIIPQPAPQWLLDLPVVRRGRVATAAGLSLFYPAAGYPHKNHRILEQAAQSAEVRAIVSDLFVTLDTPAAESGDGPIRYLGRLDPDTMRDRYASVDALVFPSLEESFGLPLVEAMTIGLPIVCADRPYARVLCGDEAIYFDPKDPVSLVAALESLGQRLEAGWWPRWDAQLVSIPKDWDDVARRMLATLSAP
jgi:glycosyltransferase involved in cell wall biosynthesis